MLNQLNRLKRNGSSTNINAGNFDFSFESQFDMFRQFCQRNDKVKVYECDELKMEEFVQEDIRQKYVSLWNDFVSIRINLFNGKLKQLFEKKLNVDKNMFNEFCKYFNYYRTLCVKLPINADNYNVPKLYRGDTRNPWFEMIEKFDGYDNVNAATSTGIQKKQKY